MSSSPQGFWIDAAVIFLYFALIVSIGLHAGRGNQTLKEFSLGGRSIPWWAVLASIVAAAAMLRALRRRRANDNAARKAA